MIETQFEGWSTCFMGLDFIGNYDRTEIISELSSYLFKNFIAYILRLQTEISVYRKLLTVDFLLFQLTL